MILCRSNDELQLEEGRILKRSHAEAERISYRDEITNCCSRCVCLIQELFRSIKVLCLLMVGYLIFFATCLMAFLIHIHARPQMPWGKTYFLVLSVMAIILDPLFFYIPVINQDKTCIELDQKLLIKVTVLRSIFDFLKLIYIFFELRVVLRDNAEIKRSRRLKHHAASDAPRKYTAGHTSPKIDARLWLLFVIDILAALPFPQVIN